MIENRQCRTPADIVSATKLQVTTCTPEEAAGRMNADRGLLVLDVRDSTEYEQAHLDTSVNVSRGLLEWKISTVCPDPDKPILVHCGSGGRAVLSVKSLMEMGYTNVTAIDATYVDIAAAMSVKG